MIIILVVNCIKIKVYNVRLAIVNIKLFRLTLSLKCRYWHYFPKAENYLLRYLKKSN